MATPKCPLIKKPCAEHDCTMYMQLQGTHPQTGETINEFSCAVTMIPVLLIENSQQQRQTGAAVESFRNAMVEDNNKLLLLTGDKPDGLQ